MDPRRSDHRLTAIETAADAERLASDPDKDSRIDWAEVAHLDRQALIHALLALSASNETTP